MHTVCIIFMFSSLMKLIILQEFTFTWDIDQSKPTVSSQQPVHDDMQKKKISADVHTCV